MLMLIIWDGRMGKVKRYPAFIAVDWQIELYDSCASRQLSISPTFYARLFRAKVSRKAFLHLDLSFVLFWRKNIGAKAARNMLVKLTTECIFFAVNPCGSIYLDKLTLN
jgi:hypothetical protein